MPPVPGHCGRAKRRWAQAQQLAQGVSWGIFLNPPQADWNSLSPTDSNPAHASYPHTCHSVLVLPKGPISEGRLPAKTYLASLLLPSWWGV